MENLELRNELITVVGADAATFSPDHNPDDLRDETLHPSHTEPFAVVRPASTQQVVEIAKLATEFKVPITPRGSGTGLSGGATPVPGGIVLSFSRMNQLLRLDVNDHVAVVQPGITLTELAEVLAPSGLSSPARSAATSTPTPAECAPCATELPVSTCSVWNSYSLTAP